MDISTHERPSITFSKPAGKSGSFYQKRFCFFTACFLGLLSTIYAQVPSLTLTTSNATSCTDMTFTLSASGADTYTWQPGNLTGSTAVYCEPDAGVKTYTVAGSNAQGATNTQTISIIVMAPPSPATITASRTSICQGDSITLNAAMSSKSVSFGTQANVNQNTSYPAPYSVCYGGQRMQVLILASELRAAGFGTGSNLAGIEFPVVALESSWEQGDVRDLQNFKISIGSTSLSTFDNAFQSGLTTVYSAPSYTPVVGDNNTHTFNTPYIWDGISNLIIETTFSNFTNGRGSMAVIQYNSPTNFQSCIVYGADGKTASQIAAATTANNLFNARPDFRLLQQNITWQPSTSLSNSNQVTAIVAPTVTTTYSLVTSNGLCSTPSNTLTVTVNRPPIIKATASSATTCLNHAISLSASGASRYTWQPGGATNYSLSVVPTSFGLNTYTVQGTDNNGCRNTATVSFQTFDTPTITSIATPVAICAGGTLSLTSPTPSANGSNISAQGWYLSDTPINNTTVLRTTDNGKTLSYRATNDCGVSMSNTVIVTVNDIPTIAAITAPAALCAGNALNITPPQVATTNGNTVTTQGWYLNGSAISNTTALSVADNGHALSYQATNSCGTATSTAVVLTVNNVPSVSSISAPPAICTGKTLHLTTPKVTAVAGNTVTAQAWHLNSSPISDTTILTASDNGKTLTYQATHTCGISISNTVSVVVNDRPSITPIALPGRLCIGSGLGAAVPQVSSNGNDVTAQNWLLSGWPITATATLIPSDNGKELFYKATNACGTSYSNTLTISMSSQSIAIAPISAPPLICIGKSLKLIAPAMNSNGNTIASQSWFLNGSPISTTPTLTMADNGKTLTYQVTSANCKSLSNAVNIAVNDVPSIQAISSTSLGCIGKPLDLLPTADNGAAITSQSWYLNNVAIGTTTTLASSDNGKTLFYKATNACGSSTSNTITLTAKPSPTVTATAASTMICLGSPVVLSASGNADSYVWTPGGATTATVSVSPGSITTYTLVGSNSAGCSASSVIRMTVSPCTGIEESFVNEKGMNVFPNPSNGLVTLEIKGLEFSNSKVNLIVYDLNGKNLLEETLHAPYSTLHIEDLSNGLYIIEVSKDQQIIFRHKLAIDR